MICMMLGHDHTPCISYIYIYIYIMPFWQVMALSDKVTDAIADGVKRLLDL